MMKKKDDKTVKDPKKSFFASFPGFRRFRPGDVITPEMKAVAVAFLSEPMGTFKDHEGFRVVIETHRDERRGEHKGATILFPDDNA